MDFLRLCGLVVVGSLAACSGGIGGDDGGSAGGPDVEPTGEVPECGDPEGLRALIQGVQPAELGEPVPEHVDPDVAVETTSEVEDGQVVECTYTTMTGVKQFETMVAMDANGDALWPGSVVQTSTLPVGLLAPIALGRAPLAITMTNALSGDAGDSYSRTIEDPSLASVNDAIGAILNTEGLSFAAKSVYSGQQVYSFDQAAVAVDLAVGWATGGVATAFDGDWETRKTRYVLKFTQNFYTVSAEPPSAPEALFDACVTAEDAGPYIQADNPPGYVSTVTYGRTLYMKIESDLKASDIEASLEGQYNGGIVDVDASVTTGFKSVLESSNVEIFALGGDPSAVAALQAVMADESRADDRAQALSDYLENGATFSVDRPVVPIGYTVRLLRDNSIIRIASPYDYKVPSCYAQADDFTLDLDALHIHSDGDDGLKGAGEITIDVYVKRSSDEIDGECSIANPTGCGTLMLSSFYTHASDGDEVPITYSSSLVFAAPQMNGETITVTLLGREDDNDDKLLISNTHQFVLGNDEQGSWTNLGPSSLRGAAANLNLELLYRLNTL